MIDISVSGLVKEFEVGSRILDGLSFQIDTGERVGLLGPNGCGKTTLLRILTGVMDYDEGDVVIAPGKRMGLISQIPVYPEGYTVEQLPENISIKLDEINASARVISRTDAQTIQIVFTYKQGSILGLPADYQSIRSFWQHLADIYGSVAVLKKI